MNLSSLPDGRIINLDHLTYAERTGDYVILHFSGAGEGARRVWACLAEKCTVKIETPR